MGTDGNGCPHWNENRHFRPPSLHHKFWRIDMAYPYHSFVAGQSVHYAGSSRAWARVVNPQLDQFGRISIKWVFPHEGGAKRRERVDCELNLLLLSSSTGWKPCRGESRQARNSGVCCSMYRMRCKMERSGLAMGALQRRCAPSRPRSTGIHRRPSSAGSEASQTGSRITPSGWCRDVTLDERFGCVFSRKTLRARTRGQMGVICAYRHLKPTPQ